MTLLPQAHFGTITVQIASSSLSETYEEEVSWQTLPCVVFFSFSLPFGLIRGLVGRILVLNSHFLAAQPLLLVTDLLIVENLRACPLLGLADLGIYQRRLCLVQQSANPPIRSDRPNSGRSILLSGKSLVSFPEPHVFALYSCDLPELIRCFSITKMSIIMAGADTVPREGPYRLVHRENA